MISWCKVASNLDSDPKIRRAGRLGREVFLFALRRNAEPSNPIPGRLPMDELEPWYLADLLQMPESEAVTGVTAAVTAGLLIPDGHSYLIAGWDEHWGKAPASGRERTAKWRDSARKGPPVTIGDGANVTESHRDARDALDQIRSDKIFYVGGAQEAPSDPGSIPTPEAPEAPDPKVARAARIPDRAWKAADYMRGLVLADAPKSVVGRKPWTDTGLRLEWADTIRLLVDRDGRTYEEVAETLRWVFTEQPPGPHRFIVQSPDALREKWDRIEANRRNKAAPVVGTGHIRKIANL